MTGWWCDVRGNVGRYDALAPCIHARTFHDTERKAVEKAMEIAMRGVEVARYRYDALTKRWTKLVADEAKAKEGAQ